MDFASTGTEGLDDILGGGLPRGHLYLVEGDPGAGKTTLGLRFLMEGAKRGERALYITLSESEEELREVATSHEWSLEGVDVFELKASEQGASADLSLFHPSEVDLSEVMKTVLGEVARVKPSRVVFDSLSVSYVADTVILTRYFEAGGQVRNALSVVKKRSGAHEKTIREFTLSRGGIRLGAPLDKFQGVLTGVPRYAGGATDLLDDDG